MREPFDIDEFIHYASQPGASAPYVKEAMGLGYSTSYVNRLIKRYVGKRPTQPSIRAANPLRDAVVRHMESQGLNRYYCINCQRRSTYECAIHPLIPRASLDEMVFVCTKRCSAPGDF